MTLAEVLEATKGQYGHNTFKEFLTRKDKMNEYDKYLTNIDKIYNHYGYDPQLNKLVEEIGELLIAISKKMK